MDTKKLRQKILDLAIRGKLVPQDPNDEPASVLLERIKAEKERLIKEGKIKRSKKTAKTSDTPHYENVSFEMPNNWVWTTVDELCDVVRGGSPRPAGDEKYYNGAIPFLKVADLTKDDEFVWKVINADYARKMYDLKIEPIYRLYEGDSESLVEDVSEITEDGIYGIEIGFLKDIKFMSYISE